MGISVFNVFNLKGLVLYFVFLLEALLGALFVIGMMTLMPFFLYCYTLYYTKLCCELMETNFELCYVDVFIGECIRVEFIIDKCKSDKRSLLGR